MNATKRKPEREKKRLPLFPPKKPQPKKTDERQVNFRPTRELAEYLDARSEQGWSKNSVVVELLQIGLDLQAEIGDEAWSVVEAYAKVEGLTLGCAIGRLTRLSVERIPAFKPQG